MKKRLNKKLLSAIAVLALTGTVAASAAACNSGGNTSGVPDGEFTGNVYYVSADGKRENDGKTVATAKDPGFMNDRQEIRAGDTIFLVPGTYEWDATWGENHSFRSQAIAITASGTPNKYISFINAALDPRSGYDGEETKVTLDFSAMEFDGSNRGVQIYGNYIYWYGIDVCGAGDNGMYIGGSYNTVEYSEFYNNRDTGLQLGRQESAQTNINQWPSYNLIKNCTSHNNYDDETFGENADGFAAKLTIGYGNVFDGCIAYRNSDDGWDLYAKSDSGNIGCVIIYNCVAFENGYLEYTQEEMHNLLNYRSEYDEPNTNSYLTRDGDGNGFKLGGSVMEGDVKMYNCLSFQNRMHGVTDNSNPGYLKIEGVTSYDNSAVIDNDPSSATFGKVISTASYDHENHGNIDVARQTYSYNTVKNVLSVKSNIAKYLNNDAYRGSVSDSLLVSGANTNVVKGSIDADTKVASAAKQYTSQVDALSAADVFKQLPVVSDGSSYTYNVDGARDMDRAVESRVHAIYRNEDHSINMGDLLAVKDGFDFASYLGTGVTAGATLNKMSWEDYSHFVDDGLLNGVSTEVFATLLKAKEALTINTDESQVYQDFEVPVRLLDSTIEWSTNSELLEIGKEIEQSVSQTQYITIGVNRPTDEDTTVTLTATIKYLNHSISKDFELVIKKDNPSIGKLSVRVVETNEKYVNNGKVIMDAYRQYGEPVLEVENGAYYNGALLVASQYTVETTYEYASSANGNYVSVSGFMVNHPGVYRITHKVTLAGTTDTASMTYQIFVASPFASVDIQHTEEGVTVDGAEVSVYKDGYIIAGDLTNVTGTLYTVASATELNDLTVENIQEYEGVEANDFRATNISFTYANANSAGYHIYYAIANVNGDMTSRLYHAEIVAKNISSTADFMKIAGGQKLSGEVVAQTIYLLTADLDFADVPYSTSTSAFSGLLNGQGHTVSNIRLESTTANTGLFPQVRGGTIENIKFDNIVIINNSTDSTTRTGIVARSFGGYYHNIAITNIYVEGSTRVGGLIAHVYEGATPTDVSQVSIVNPMPDYNPVSGAIDTTKEGQYYITGSGNRVAGIIGFIQANNPITNSVTVRVNDCYVESYINSSGYSISSIVGEFNENGQMANVILNGYDFGLEINNCVSAGVLVGTGSSGRIGGMLGYHNGGGRLHIISCVSIQSLYYKGALLEVAQKNQSGTIGNFSTADTADVLIGQCIALFEEYNSDYDVTAYTHQQLTLIQTFGITSFDFNEKWSLVFADSGTMTLARPYLQLNFLGEWD